MNSCKKRVAVLERELQKQSLEIEIILSFSDTPMPKGMGFLIT